MEIHEIVKFCRAGSRFQDRLAREIDFSFIYFIRSTVLYYSLELRLALSLFMLIFLSPGLPPQAIMYRFIWRSWVQDPLQQLGSHFSFVRNKYRSYLALKLDTEFPSDPLSPVSINVPPATVNPISRQPSQKSTPRSDTLILVAQLFS